MSKAPFIANIIVATGYFLAGYVGLLLYIPPTNAIVLWPAAGLALAALIIAGPRVLPGLLSGVVLVQAISNKEFLQTAPPLEAGLIVVVIAAGAVCQAWLGAKLLQFSLDRDRGLIKERSILFLCLFVAPLSCVVSATVATSTFLYRGMIELTDLSYSWSIWWLGDFTGVVVFAPIVLCFCGEPRSLWRQRVSTVALPLCILSIISSLIFSMTFKRELRDIEAGFKRNASSIKNEFERSIYANVESVRELKEFFDSSDAVSKQEFASFSGPKLVRHKSIKALEWIPFVAHQDRAYAETQLGTDIKATTANGQLQRADTEDFYYPITYLEPLAGNEPAFGFDIRSNPAARLAADHACNSGELTVTRTLKLAQEMTNKLGVVFYAPVYNKPDAAEGRSDCENLVGLVASVFRLQNEFSAYQNRLAELGMSVSLQGDGFELYSGVRKQNTERRSEESLVFAEEYNLPVANQLWQLRFRLDVSHTDIPYSPVVWQNIIFIAIISTILSTGLLLLTGRTLQTESKIKKRTRELRKEVRERKSIASILELENRFLEMIAQDYSMYEILDAITTGIENIVPDMLSSILLLDTDGKHLIHGSAPNLPVTYTAAVDGVEIGPQTGSCGTAAFLNEQVVVSDIEHDPLWENYSELALQHELKACWSTPISIGDGKVLGSFAMYFHEVKEPNTELINLANRMANVAAIVIMRKQTQEQLNFHASHDALTGLVNRREFERRATRLLTAATQYKDEHALCFMDLDQFKIVNDTCGHTAGDELLRQLALVLQKDVRKRDTLARLGGDEFGVLMEYCSLEHALRVANTLQKAVQDFQFIWEGQSFRIGISMGVVAVTENIRNLSELMKHADAACYMAKDLGRNRIHVYREEDANIAQRHGEMQWVTRIYQALEEDRFCLYAQKIEAIDGSNTRHYELLVRMEDDDGTHIPPGAFLPAAERYNLISNIDRWVIEKAFALLSSDVEFQKQIQFISINLSGQSLTTPDMLEFLIRELHSSGIAAGKFCFEITETAAITNLSTAISFITSLKENGCRFALDDFGSGLSSFAYLKNLPVDYLKIDGMFVKDIVDNPVDHAMVKSINEIGQVMGMKTIAEFVENDDIKQMLKALGVNYAQGYGIEKPRPFEEILCSGSESGQGNRYESASNS